MSTVAAISNPLDATEALLFYCTPQCNLALEHRPLGSTQYVAYIDNGSPKSQGLIAQPGQFAVVQHNKTVCVYGLINTLDGVNKVTLVSILSPTINPVAPYSSASAVTTYTALAATGDGGVNDYVYFLQQNPSTGNPVIIEYTFDADPTGGSNPLEFCHPAADTQLAACYDKTGGFRMVFFQNISTDRQDIWYTRVDQGTENFIQETSNVEDGTPLAAITRYETVGDTTNPTVYLYYVDRDSTLTRVSFDERAGQWSSPSAVKGANSVPASSGLAVVADPTLDVNHVFVLSGGAYTSVPDNLASN